VRFCRVIPWCVGGIPAADKKENPAISCKMFRNLQKFADYGL